MLKHIRVVPLAAESLGVRSMCTYVETADVKVLLDAGVSLCPMRFGLPPHPLEFKAIMDARKRIAEMAEKAEVISLSHYHFDHHTPSYEDWLCNWTAENKTAKQIYEEKIVLIKNPKEKVNFSQRRRGWLFQKTSGKHARKIEIADGKNFNFGKSTTIRFSEPVFHGPEDTALGWVLIITIECEGERFMFAPDVQGPVSALTLQVILTEQPQLLMIGGPPLYLAKFRIDETEVQAGLENLRRIVEVVPEIMVEHHILRSEDWKKSAKAVFNTAEKNGHRVLTAAEFLGKQNMLLESKRKALFAADPPSKDFEKWMRKDVNSKKKTKPPI